MIYLNNLYVISNCGRNRLRAEHLMRALLLIFFLSAENERERVLKTDTLFRTNIDIFECFVLQYTTEFTRFSLPLNQKKTVWWSCSVGVADVPLLIKFSQDWKRYLAFLVSESTYGMLHVFRARKLSLDNEKLFEKKKENTFYILSFEKLRNKND